MTAPNIESSTREERLDYVLNGRQAGVYGYNNGNQKQQIEYTNYECIFRRQAVEIKILE